MWSFALYFAQCTFAHNCILMPRETDVKNEGGRQTHLNEVKLAKMEEKAMTKKPLEAIEEHFSQVNGPRKDRTKEHKLIDVIAIPICAVILDKPITFAAVGNGNIKHLGTPQCLLHPGADPVAVVLGFDDCQRQVLPVKQDVIGRVQYPARHSFPPHMDFPQREFFQELQVVPARDISNGRRDEFRADITLREGFLVERAFVCHQ